MNYNGSEINAITSKVDKAIQSNDNKIIDSILETKNYTSFTLAEKEKIIFRHASLKFSLFEQGKSIVQYLIFDYKISLDNSLYYMNEHVDKEIQSMFDTRLLNDDLQSELKVSDKLTKTVKV